MSKKTALLNFFQFQEDAHIAQPVLFGDKEKALFGVFDGHGGREVAVYSNRYYQEILGKDYQTQGKDNEQEWLRQSFLKVDVELRTEKGQNEVGDLRR